MTFIHPFPEKGEKDHSRLHCRCHFGGHCRDRCLRHLRRRYKRGLRLGEVRPSLNPVAIKLTSKGGSVYLLLVFGQQKSNRLILNEKHDFPITVKRGKGKKRAGQTQAFSFVIAGPKKCCLPRGLATQKVTAEKLRRPVRRREDRRCPHASAPNTPPTRGGWSDSA